MSDSREYGVGMIGFGGIARVHAYAHASLPFLYRPLPFSTALRGVCTSRGDTAMAAMDEGHFQFATTDPSELISRSDIDIIHVCTPNDSHRELSIAALEAGKHVYCEKPLADDLDGAREMLHVASASGRTHQVTFQYRFVPAIMRAKQLVDEGLVGAPLAFRFCYLHAGYTDGQRPMSWRLDADKSGGGALFDLGSHAIDLVQHLVGDVTRVSAALPTFVHDRPVAAGSDDRAPVHVDDHAVMLMETDTGAVGTVEASRVATGTTDDLTLEIHGTNGALKFDLMDPNWLHVYDARAGGSPIGGRRGYTKVQTVQEYPEPASLPSPKATVGWLRFHIASLHAFMTNVHEGRVGDPSFADGAAVQAVLQAAQTSHQTGSWSEVPEIARPFPA
ncbi:Gfo/Idh/MocA family oxidoreductase [Candidatus Poribacteria bacterium]|jgi:predicted dehydrogenase|nr:Gfo/Idh/MocA family oxidoreductase [Candidatus Poribacteria bacterium]MBT5711891.1 Gfo/Idh/MocA family oxidoreductase [Candidatus Poribacteria bacterium]MBT7101249.1 Gfo/Idh/MocA family oxidoreductase [Candidatus Poribacteria bacterium]MBT7805934.1 Gfo/Idh/MocA family oxidoreductase [Candidatus Poribacteria bacterium]